MVKPGSHQKVWWRCSDDPSHEWEAVVKSRTQGTGCPMCSGRVATPTISLRVLYPQLSQDWHSEKNGILTPNDVRPGSNQKVWWCCANDPSHEWEATVVNRTRVHSGCPYCNSGWTIAALRHFVASLLEHLQVLTPAELYVLFQQSGLARIKGQGKSLVKSLAAGRFPLDGYCQLGYWLDRKTHHVR
jgi:hypothetical protein